MLVSIHINNTIFHEGKSHKRLQYMINIGGGHSNNHVIVGDTFNSQS